MLQSQKQKGYKNSPQSKTRFKLWRQYIAGIPLILLVSCTNTGENTQGTQEPIKNANTSVVKVLNRVKCMEDETYCSQGAINLIWQSCVKDGYVTSTPPQQVVSSRELKELTKNIVSVNINKSQEVADKNGIVYESDEVVTTQENRTITGYCIGSEYIIKG